MSEFSKLKEFIKLAKDEGVLELKYELKDEQYFVSFAGSPIVSSGPAQTISSPSQDISENSQSMDTAHAISSPFVGTFYSSPAPDKPVFVKVGDRVSKGQTLCILEAMKIMNEIESDVAGEVVEVCIENESLVEFGQVLFKIKV